MFADSNFQRKLFRNDFQTVWTAYNRRVRTRNCREIPDALLMITAYRIAHFNGHTRTAGYCYDIIPLFAVYLARESYLCAAVRLLGFYFPTAAVVVVNYPFVTHSVVSKDSLACRTAAHIHNVNQLYTLLGIIASEKANEKRGYYY